MGKGFWKDYFSFSKRERAAVSVLMLIIVVFIFLPGFFAPRLSLVAVDQQLQRRLDSIAALGTSQRDEGTNAGIPKTDDKLLPAAQLSPFLFDPNTLTAEGFQQMGLKEKIIQTILNYRGKGGVFRKPDDIRKMYGLTKEEADQLTPFIKITRSDPLPGNQQEQDQRSTSFTQKSNPYNKIDINTATEDEWKTLPGIGDVLSKRIVKFRNAVKGFKSIEDIRKTYGLPDSTYQLILPYLMLGETTSGNNASNQ